MGKVRYVEKGKQVHPYKPWDDKADNADMHFRAFKACQNGVEWTTFAVPLLFLFNLYTPAVPFIGAYAPWGAALLGLAFGYYNVEYIKGYIKSADDRMPGFKMRTLCFRGIFYGFVAGAACSVLKQAGVLAA